MTPSVIEAESEGQLFKSHVVTVDPPRGGSTQPANSDDPDLGTPDDALQPPLSMEQLAFWSQINSTRASCIAAMAKNVVGLGYTLVVEDGHEEADTDPRKTIQEAIARLEAVAARDTRLEQPSFTALLEAVKTDEEEVGWGFLEVSRNKTNGIIDGLFHLPAKRMRRLKSRNGYLLLPPSGDSNDATYYAPFGTKVEYDETGQPTGTLDQDHDGGWRRNEVIVFRLYTSETRDYGLPRDHALAVEYLGDKLAAESNAAFFETGGVLPTVLFVQGDEEQEGSSVNVTIPAEVTQRINAVMKSKGAGPAGTGRLAIIPLPKGVKAQKEVLGNVSERDLGFVAFRDDMRQRTLSAFRISPIFIALMDDSRYGAEVERAITKEQVFDGEQTRYETRLTATVIKDIGFPQLAIAFNDLAIEDDAAKRDSSEKLGEAGDITRREHRGAHGFAPLPEAKKSETEIEWKGGTYKSEEPEPGQVPAGWNDELLPATGLPAGAQNRVVDGTSQQGLTPGLGGRESQDRGQAASAARVGAQTRRLAKRTASANKGGARRAVARARALQD